MAGEGVPSSIGLEREGEGVVVRDRLRVRITERHRR